MSAQLINLLIAILVELFSALLSFGVGAAGAEIFKRIFKRIVSKQQKQDSRSASEKLAMLTESLVIASKEVDSVLLELSQVAKDREQAVQKIEADLQNLQNREKVLQQKIDILQNVPLPVAEYFAELTASGEKKSAKRDYLLFGAGVVVSTIIAILLKLLGIG